MSSWQDSDQSSDEFNHDIHFTARKRSSRACDQCRKTKSKCERQPNAQCKSCTSAGTTCTFLGPSYKRGPPKGYIHAIEQRWQQVESLLGVIISSSDTRAQSIISDLRKDELAREIINRVERGPFGPGRLNTDKKQTKEDFFAAIIRGGETSPLRENPRSRRQSRVSREFVSSAQDTSLSFIPTANWQSQLLESLTLSSANMAQLANTKNLDPYPAFDPSGTPPTRRRRLDPLDDPNRDQPDWNEMYTMDSDDDEEYETATETSTGIGQLSLEDNHEVRYLGKASGLQLLGRTDRTDARQKGGVWVMPREGPLPTDSPKGDDLDLVMPPIDIRNRLVDVYFDYVHPAFPVIHKDQFLLSYETSVQMSQGGDLECTLPFKPGSTRFSKVLLSAMIAIAAQYCRDELLMSVFRLWDAECGFFDQAARLWSKVLHRNQLSTCQALLLLGYRQFGLGGTEQAWIYIGTAIRMALDLGLNRNSDNWQMDGAELFSKEQKQERLQVWWACCIADKHCSVFMGRPVAIRDDDFDTKLPEVDSNEEKEIWESPSGEPMTGKSAARTIMCFRASAELSVIVGAIAMKLYPVRTIKQTARREVLGQLEAQLHQWYFKLHKSLQYNKAASPPHILLLHISYWGAVLLLHRALLPNWKRNRQSSPQRNRKDSDASMRALDTCQIAANHITSIVDVHLEQIHLNFCSPLLSAYILNAGIMHVATLTIRPSDFEASQGLKRCLEALKSIQELWPSASHAWELINGVRVSSDRFTRESSSDRQKRRADAAFGNDGGLTDSPTHSQVEFHPNGVSSSCIVNGMSSEPPLVLGFDLMVDTPAPYGSDWDYRGKNVALPQSESSLLHSSTYPALSSPPTNATFSGAQILLHGWVPAPPERSSYSFDPRMASHYGI